MQRAVHSIWVSVTVATLVAVGAPAAARRPEAVALYEQARAALPNRDELHRLLDRAIELDPTYAAAYALKGEQYAAAIAQAIATNDDPADAVVLHGLAVSNAQLALERDPALDSALAALGLAQRQLWYWNEALDAYGRAYRLAPQDATASVNWVWMNSFAGKHDIAIAAAQRGVETHPMSANAHRDLGLANAYAGRPEPASAALRKCMELDDRVSICHIYLALMQVRLGNAEVARSELAAAEHLFGGAPTPATISSVAHAYSRAGAAADAQRLFTRLQAQDSAGVVGAGSWPLGYLAIGDADSAYRWLERAVAKIERHEPDEGFFNLMIIKANVGANPVLDEPRFRALRARIGGP
jgi:tetratricopeptide (TPR) repeat protein